MKMIFPEKVKILLLLLTTVMCLAACRGKKDEENEPRAVTTKQVVAEVDTIIGVANIEPVGKILPLSVEVSGIVAEIYADANQSVDKGDRIIALDHQVQQRQLEQARSKLGTQQAVISAAQATLASQEVKLANARNTYERDQRLFNGGAETQQTLDDSKTQYEQLRKDVDAARATLVQQQRRLTELQTDLAYNQALLDQRFIKAPARGMVLSVDTKVGESVSSGTSLGDFAPEGGLMAVTEIDELFAPKVKAGQSAFIRPQGGTEILAKGKVFFTSSYLKKKSLFADKAENLEDRRVREVRVRLDSNSRILIGSRVECVIKMK
ncbi:HlyD family efflux transporter periplasmic adaptor subunit [Cytophagaceae bacterium YF14B1]|uniref:HlyD family efflux transporter periplasmic adaptor subunit n=1 Tax=Xanthocytophaga flava TaxID=3048013 RepID=A0AAE3QPZ0_9BACT|nr:HlyD family efflux transporter periplasmic adaptor subunit [Xanthocytophaga flavus]MDJ1483135.1 HlyD family efflux transporter periplasmic adaptor subunit [Xanthocytophaga flavus]